MGKFTRAEQETLAPGFYWIRRAEPDGPPEWEVARFDGSRWYVTGSSRAQQPTKNPDASNAWHIGGRVERRDESDAG